MKDTLLYQSKFSGVDELLAWNPDRLVRNPEQLAGKKVFLADGSTTVANCRGIEIVTTLIAGRSLRGFAKEIKVLVVGGGSSTWAVHDLGIKFSELKANENTVNKLRVLYPNVIFDERNFAFLPPEALILPNQGINLRQLNLAARRDLLLKASKIVDIHMPPVSVQGFENGQFAKATSLGKVFEKSDQDKIAAKFTCPDCSRQRGNPIEHGILPNGIVVRTTGTEVKCKAALDIKKHLRNGDLQDASVDDLIRLGFYLSGKVLYQVFSQTMDIHTDALLVRNYSNGRGTMSKIDENWKGQLGVTRRFYFEGKREIPGKDILKTLSENTSLRNSIRKEDLLISKSEGDVYLPC